MSIQNTLRLIKLMTPSDVFISAITLMEINYGMLLNAERTAKIRPVIEDFLDAITYLNFNTFVKISEQIC